mgnify:CR=1 FL=1
MENNFKHPLLTHHWTFRQRAADALTNFLGSWKFILFLAVFICIWIFLNVYAYFNRWDPYPFILLNLFLSCLAAIEVPIILMSQNRHSEKDRLRAEYDYLINRKAEKEIRDLKKEIQGLRKVLRR